MPWLPCLAEVIAVAWHAMELPQPATALVEDGPAQRPRLSACRDRTGAPVSTRAPRRGPQV